MTYKEAILKVLLEHKKKLTGKEVYEIIEKNKYVNWDGATPQNTVNAILGRLYNNDSRVNRIKEEEGYKYYLSTYEDDIDFTSEFKEYHKDKITILERDLHKILSSYLKVENVYSRTVFHEKSTNSKEKNQIWTHPDMIGVKFLNLESNISQSFRQLTNIADSFELTSFELKVEITGDKNLKECYFQAVSNSSWANYGYLVALEIPDKVLPEMERLNQSFGIGVIQLKPNPFESKVLFPAKRKNLDFITLDKVCNVNPDFSEFIEKIDALIKANNKGFNSLLKDFIDSCDTFLSTDFEVKEYCKLNNIPIEEN